MKQLCSTLLLCFFLINNVHAASRYWVGTINAEWNNPENWSETLNGVGGASVPAAADTAVFSNFTNDARIRSVVHVGQSNILARLKIEGRSDVVLSVSTPVVFTINNSFFVDWQSTLKDSTSADVPFNMVFNGATAAQGLINGTWLFEGSTPINRNAGHGATFTPQDGSYVQFISTEPQTPSPGGIAIFRNNTNYIKSNVSTLFFSQRASYILENNLDAAIPEAGWGQGVVNGVLTPIYDPSIKIIGSMGKLVHLQHEPYYRNFIVDLPLQSGDAFLNFPTTTGVAGSLTIGNNNNQTCILLASPAIQANVSATIAELVIGGKVAMAKASASAPGSNFKLGISGFTQTAGNFSLQDFTDASGESTLSVVNSMKQTGGSFVTNSNSTKTGAAFVVEMAGPIRSQRFPSSIVSAQTIQLSSGSIDNTSHTVTLRIAHLQYLGTNGARTPGVDLASPLIVGKLDLVTGTINSSSVNVLTVNNPDARTGIVVENMDSSYVNGPIRRVTNSTDSYIFPTGKGNISTFKHYDSCVVIPASAEPSLYQAEYYNGGYPDLNVTAPLTGVLATKFWNITRMGGADAAVKLYLNDGAIAGASPADALVVAGYINGHWVAVNGTSLTPANANGGSVTSKFLSAPGLFTFGYGNPAALNAGNPGTFNGLNYKYYEGGYSLLPDFTALTPVKTGSSDNFDIGIHRTGVTDSFAIVWEGYINIPAAGSYTFETVSDDGSKFYFNSLYNANAIALVDNDGTHPPQSASGTVNIAAAGRYPVTLAYFENYGDEGLEVYWSGPGFSRQRVPSSAFTDGTTPPATTSGLSYKYYEGSFDLLPNFAALTPVKTGSSPNVDISVRPAGVNDNFAFTWDGTITIPSSGTYVFETISDDGSKINFNGNNIVVNDGLHAPTSVTGSVTIAAGTYPISVSYFEKDGGETMQLYWSGPGISRQLIPDEAFGNGTVTPPSGSGLSYKYYEGDFNVLPDFSALIPVKTGTGANADISVRPAGVNDHFAFVWQGNITIPTSGTYVFEAISDDGSKINFNGNNIVVNDGLHAPTSITGSVTIAAGTYPISVSYFEKDGGETMQLYWSGPGISRQLIPDAAFGGNNYAATVTTAAQLEVTGNNGMTDRTSTKIYPNPFFESFTVDYYNPGTSNGKVTIGVYDLNGRMINNYQPANMVVGNNRWLINMGSGSLLPGVYMAQVKINGVAVKSIKLLKTIK